MVPIRRQRDHPGVAAAGDELYQQHNYSSQISVLQSHSKTQYNTTQAIALGYKHYSTLGSFLFLPSTKFEIINSLKSDFHQHGSALRNTIAVLSRRLPGRRLMWVKVLDKDR